MRKVTIIGAGNVGATIAYTLAVEGFVNEVLLIDIRAEKAAGEAMDIAQGAPFYSGTRVTSGDYADAVDSDMVIITSGVGRKPGQSRLDLAQINVNILSDIAPQITKYAPNAIYLIVSNPVDVLTYVFHKITNVPAEHILGSGTILDTSRVRSYLAKHFDISQQNIHTHVLGEHGDSSFIPWSQASVSSVDIDKYASLIKAHGMEVPALDRAAVEEHVRSSGSQIIARKGATYYAVAVATVHICKCIFGDNDTALTVSTMLDGEYGISGVTLDVPALLGANGVDKIIDMRLTDEEYELLKKSEANMREAIASVEGL